MKKFKVDMEKTLTTTTSSTSNLLEVETTSISTTSGAASSTTTITNTTAATTVLQSPIIDSLPLSVPITESSANNAAAKTAQVAASSIQQKQQSTATSAQNTSPPSNSGEQKRPMNAFLMFCKRHRSLVKEKNPQLENRGITKILGDWWSKLDKSQKSSYTELARQHKEAFMKANPDFKWYKTDPRPMPTNNNNSNSNNYQNNDRQQNETLSPGQNFNNYNSVANIVLQNCRETITNNLESNSTVITPNSDMKNYSSADDSLGLMARSKNHLNRTTFNHSNNSKQQLGAPKPPKKRYLENGQHQEPSKDRWNVSNQTNNQKILDPIAHTKERVVPFPLVQDTFEKVIDRCYSETSDGNSSGTSSESSGHNNSSQASSIPPLIYPTKCYPSSLQPLNPRPILNYFPDTSGYPLMNLMTTVSGPSLTSLPHSKIPPRLPAPTNSSSSSYSKKVENDDEPVDFSMNRTITTNRQQIINNLIERILSEPDLGSASARSNGFDAINSTPLSMVQNQTANSIQSIVNTNNSDFQQLNFLEKNSIAINLNLPTSSSSSNNNLTQVDKGKNPLKDFDLEKKLTELPLFELSNTQFEHVDNECRLDGLATLAEAAFLTQNSETSRDVKTPNAAVSTEIENMAFTAGEEAPDVNMRPENET